MSTPVSSAQLWERIRAELGLPEDLLVTKFNLTVNSKSQMPQIWLELYPTEGFERIFKDYTLVEDNVNNK